MLVSGITYLNLKYNQIIGSAEAHDCQLYQSIPLGNIGKLWKMELEAVSYLYLTGNITKILLMEGGLIKQHFNWKEIWKWQNYLRYVVTDVTMIHSNLSSIQVKWSIILQNNTNMSLVIFCKKYIYTLYRMHPVSNSLSKAPVNYFWQGHFCVCNRQ